MRQKDRVSHIKQKFGKNAFRVWGRKGGSPVLLAYAKGKIQIVK